MILARGLGATDAPDCTSFFTWPPNVFNPVCYQTAWARTFGTPEEKLAAEGVLHPDELYPTTLKPVGGAPPAPTNLIDPCAGRVGADYYACVVTTPNTMVAEEEARQQTTNQQFFTDLAASLDAKKKGYADTGGGGAGDVSTLVWVGLALGVVGVLGVMGSGKGRR